MKPTYAIPTNDPEPLNLPQSINENEELDFSTPPMAAAPGEDEDEGPGRSFIRNEGFENISAEEFKSTVKEREMFLSQSCPTWTADFTLPDFPPRPPRPEAHSTAPEEDSEEVAATEIKFAKLSFEEFSDNLADLGRSPTIFESLKFVGSADVSAISSIPEEEEGATDAPVQETDALDDELGFEMDDVNTQ